ncbi:unnamed protein product [Spirodela intermedia]|uniref:Zinc finger LSD1-type domain-containing protein n=2 Tax=Spirodela intermedia TaxID=51605 RepID=A0A7I8ISZ2_SPIIN|nr:unnamed protein product [Spirodela intermedia]CAA6661092.1 unnamed protein product [Spirodela intermedia]CAA7397458.1 unnamed protein product [Spirodela intermedia]
MGQMVCGSCRQLLSYPQHANCVRCTCCQTINLVLEAHQVGNVKCGKCCILLMYPYGAPAVRCSCCRFVTEIGVRTVLLSILFTHTSIHLTVLGYSLKALSPSGNANPC